MVLLKSQLRFASRPYAKLSQISDLVKATAHSSISYVQMGTDLPHSSVTYIWVRAFLIRFCALPNEKNPAFNGAAHYSQPTQLCIVNCELCIENCAFKTEQCHFKPETIGQAFDLLVSVS